MLCFVLLFVSYFVLVGASISFTSKDKFADQAFVSCYYFFSVSVFQA